MNNLGMSRIRRESQRLFLNGVELHGVQSANLQWDNQSSFIKHIGQAANPTVLPALPFGPGQASFNVNGYICEQPFHAPGGFKQFYNGVVIQDKTNLYNNYGFTSGYLTSYSAKGSVGEIPQYEANFVVYGQAGRIDSTDSPQIATQFTTIGAATDNFSPRIAGPGTLLFYLDSFDNEFTTNRVQSFEYNASYPTSPQYILGQRFPNRIEAKTSIEVSYSFTFEPDTYVPQKMWDFPCSTTQRTVSIYIYRYQYHPGLNQNQIVVYGGPVMINSESYNSSVDSNSRITLNFKGLI